MNHSLGAMAERCRANPFTFVGQNSFQWNQIF